MRSLKIALALILAVPILGPVASAAAQERTVTITGGGYGHGIGMSQWGSYGRAKKGKTATEILEHYYTGAKVTPQTIKGNVRVGLLPVSGSSRASISFTSEAFGDGSGDLTLKESGSAEELASGAPGTEWTIEASSTGGMKVFKNGKKIERDGKSVFGDPDSPLVVIFQNYGSLFAPVGKDPKYAYGTAEIGTYSSSSCTDGYCARLVLRLSMQKYLYGLGEVPSSWPGAALRAQAISGRTYAYNKKTAAIRYPCGCHVLDSTLDQAYIGDSKRTGSGEYWDDWKAAVDDTEGQILTYEGEVVRYALYSASSGGYTESNEAVWGSTPVPYLQPVPDAADRAGGANPHFVWEPITMTWDEFSSKLNASFGTGEVKDFELVKPFGESGRVTVVNDDGTGGVRIVGAGKTARVDGWDIRSALGLKDTLFRVDIGQVVGRRFRNKYDSLNGAPGPARSSVYPVPKGWKTPQGKAQDFRKGRMTYTKSVDKVVWQWGPILKAYDALGREKSSLGMPITGIWGPGEYRGGTYVEGRIIYTSERGSIPIVSVFEDAFLRNGGISGELGLPRAARESRETLPDGGRRQRFDGGTLYKVGAGAGVFALFGAIDERYREMGEAASACGYPTADQYKDGEVWRAAFDHGTIVLRANGTLNVNCG